MEVWGRGEYTFQIYRAEEQTGATTEDVVSVTRIPGVPMQIHPPAHCTHGNLRSGITAASITGTTIDHNYPSSPTNLLLEPGRRI